MLDKFFNKDQLITKINSLSANNEDFMFIVDFSANNGLVIELSQLKNYGIACEINGENFGVEISNNEQISEIKISPIPFLEYQKSFNIVKNGLLKGDTYLLNLTFPTQIISDINLESIYLKSRSKYKFLLPDKFLFYSPEPFIKIENNKIYSFPMKGTILASVPNAEQVLLSDKKELYEHFTIVDLIRNDLGMVADNIEVEEFRYIEKIQTAKGDILQTSSKISGDLPSNWQENFGEMLFRLLPAGSISGAPKQKTLEIIKEAEVDGRNFYTGIMGIYKNGCVNSCVIIRYIEKLGKKYFYRSGGGITALSNDYNEYNELIEKIYIPI